LNFEILPFPKREGVKIKKHSLGFYVRSRDELEKVRVEQAALVSINSWHKNDGYLNRLCNPCAHYARNTCNRKGVIGIMRTVGTIGRIYFASNLILRFLILKIGDTYLYFFIVRIHDYRKSSNLLAYIWYHIGTFLLSYCDCCVCRCCWYNLRRKCRSRYEWSWMRM